LLLTNLERIGGKMSKNWYFTVNEYCQHVSQNFDIPLIKVAGILSALSPQNKFEQNLKDLENFIETNGNCKVSTFGNQKNKAMAILESKACTEESIKALLGKGQKTLAFFENIYRPETSESVTVDLWQIRWAKRLNIIPENGTLTEKRYRKISARVTKYANKLGIMPHQFQALTWVYLRGETF